MHSIIQAKNVLDIKSYVLGKVERLKVTIQTAEYVASLAAECFTHGQRVQAFALDWKSTDEYKPVHNRRYLIRQPHREVTFAYARVYGGGVVAWCSSKSHGGGYKFPRVTEFAAVPDSFR